MRRVKRAYHRTSSQSIDASNIVRAAETWSKTTKYQKTITTVTWETIISYDCFFWAQFIFPYYRYVYRYYYYLVFYHSYVCFSKRNLFSLTIAMSIVNSLLLLASILSCRYYCYYYYLVFDHVATIVTIQYALLLLFTITNDDFSLLLHWYLHLCTYSYSCYCYRNLGSGKVCEWIPSSPS